MHYFPIKRIVVLILCFSLLLSMAGCIKGQEISDTQSSQYKPINDQFEQIDGAQIIEDTPYFKISEENGLYAYAIYSQSGDLVKYENRLTSQPRISLLDNNLVEVLIQAGTGVGTQSGFYYDFVHDRSSDVYQSVLDQHGNLVAYATEKSIIVRDIFDKEGFWLELSSFSNTFSNVAFPFVSATFSKDGLSIQVTYLAGDDYEEISETFEMGLQNNS